jgi:Ca2+-binding RTX toxin-like protein
LRGTDENDWIMGGGGKDSLYGVSGKDIFVFRPGDYGKDDSGADTIFDFSNDKIDLTKIDANTKTRETEPSPSSKRKISANMRANCGS